MFDFEEAKKAKVGDHVQLYDESFVIESVEINDDKFGFVRLELNYEHNPMPSGVSLTVTKQKIDW